MIKTLKMTDITKSEVENILKSVKYSSVLGCDVFENDMETVLRCDVNDSNKFVFASVFSELTQFVYSDEDESPFDRLCSLVEIRKLKIGIIDQGFRGKLSETLLAKKCDVKYFVGFNSLSDMNDYFQSDDLKVISEKFAKYFGLDVVIAGNAEIDGNGLISSLCKIAVWSGGHAAEKSYYLLGTIDDIANKLSFLSAALADKEIY